MKLTSEHSDVKARPFHIFSFIIFISPFTDLYRYGHNWQFLSLEKDQWGNIHIFSGLLFLISGGFHIYYNWKPLINYLSAKVEKVFRFKRELVISTIVFLWIVLSGIWSLPPLAYVTSLGEAVKNSWVTSPELEPPFGHAELVSLQTFCKKQQIPLDQAMQELRKAGFQVNSPKSTLKEIAKSKQTSGMGVYVVLKKLEPKLAEMIPGEKWTAENVEETFAGKGLGKKTLGQIIKELELDSTKVYQKLKNLEIEANDEDKIKSLADKNNTTPIKLMTKILVDHKNG